MLNVGFIGCGGIARHHATRMKQLKNARIVAVSDVVESAAQSFAVDFGGAPFTERMPWQSASKMTDDDLAALYAYLKAPVK